MESRNFRYKDNFKIPPYPQTRSSHTKKQKEESAAPLPSEREKKAFPLSLDKLKNLSSDDYIIMFLIFMLIKDNEKPDWPLILALGYILLGE